MLWKCLHSICQQIWKTEQWPQDWKRSVFIPIPKKGNAKECSNYRTMYLSHTLVAAAATKSPQSCLTLCDPIDGSPPGSAVPGILQARTLESGAIALWDQCNCVVAWTFFGIALFGDWNENWTIPVLWPLLSFPDLLAYWMQHFHSIILGFEIVQLEFHHLH